MLLRISAPPTDPSPRRPTPVSLRTGPKDAAEAEIDGPGASGQGASTDT